MKKRRGTNKEKRYLEKRTNEEPRIYQQCYEQYIDRESKTEEENGYLYG